MPQKCKLIDYGLINWSIYMLVLEKNKGLELKTAQDKDITLITAKNICFVPFLAMCNTPTLQLGWSGNA